MEFHKEKKNKCNNKSASMKHSNERKIESQRKIVCLSYLLTCNAPALVQPNCFRLLYYQQQHEHDDETRVQHSKMDLYANAIPYNETEGFDVPPRLCPRKICKATRNRQNRENQIFSINFYFHFVY